MSVPTSLRVILDDNAGDIQYGPDWELNAQAQWYLGSTFFPSYNRTTFGSFNLSFEGTSIAFIGNTPSPSSSQIATFSIDGGTPYNSSYDGPPSQQSYQQWYQSPLLADGLRTIAVDHLDGTAIDMALITVGPNTPLTNRNIFVDNNDPAITYAGSWIEDQSLFHAGNLPGGPPVGNSTQRSTTPGDSMSFSFTGTSISVYGIFGWANIGSISATYTLDGDAVLQTYSVTSDTPQRAEDDATNFLFYSKNNLTPSAHTLVVNITDIVNQTFKMDYLVYSPSFSSLANMPDLSTTTQTAATTSATATGTNPVANQKAAPTSLTSGTTQTAVPTAAGTIVAQSGQISRKNAPVGAIVGSIIGVVFVGALIVILLLRLRKAHHKRDWKIESMPDNPSAFTDGQA